MYDASSGVQPGFIRGNINDLGDFDECVKTQTSTFHGQYCAVIMKPKTGYYTQRESLKQLTIKFSLCVPTSCTANDVKTLLDTQASNLPQNIAISVPPANCLTEHKRDLRMTDYITL